MTLGAPITGDIDKTNVSYNVSLQYAMDDDHKFYFTHATGFKSGGFDLRGAGNPATFVFGEEESKNFEIGGKHTFLDGSLRFNWTIFHTEVDDLQVAAVDATSEGIEVDLLWATPVEGLTLSFVGAYTEAEYDRFVGSCYLSQVENGTGCFNVGISQGQRAGVQDLAGETLPIAPEWTFVLGGEYTMPAGSTMELSASAKYIYIGEQFMSIERDPSGFQNSTERVDASLVLSGNTSGDQH